MNKLERYLWIDGLRGVLALAVVLSHIYGSLFSYKLGRPFQGAYLAVDMFFIISGFVLSNYIINKNPEIYQYVVARFLRLWPLYIASITATMVVLLNNKINKLYIPNFDFTDFNLIIKNVLFLNNFIFEKIQSINDPSWSISVEFWVSAMVLFYLIKLKAISVFIIFISVFAFYQYGCNGGLGCSDELNFGISYGLMRAVMGISIGALIYKVQLYYLERNFKFPAINIVLLFLYGISAYYIYTAQASKIDYLIIAIFIIAFCLNLKFDNKIKIILSSDIFNYLGKISFPIYLLHTPVILYIMPGNYISLFGVHGAAIYTLLLCFAVSHFFINFRK